MSKAIAKAERKAAAATGLFQTAIAGLEQANDQLAAAEAFHQQEAQEHALFADQAKEGQKANNKVLETLRTLVP